MILEKLPSLPTKVSPWFTSVFSKSVHQFQKSVQLDLKPVQPVFALFLLSLSDLPVYQSILSKMSCAEFFENQFVGEEISPAGCRIAPALNPKKRRGLSVLLATGLVDQHTGTREGLEWFGPPERNTLLHCVMYCLGACMNL
jgi:hypothetical protein